MSCLYWLCRHLQARVSSNMQTGSALRASDPGLHDEVAAIQRMLLAAIVIHTQHAMQALVLAISKPDAGTCHVAKAFMEAVLLPVALGQDGHHVNGFMKPLGSPGSLPAGSSISPASLQQALRHTLKGAYQGRQRLMTCLTPQKLVKSCGCAS